MAKSRRNSIENMFAKKGSVQPQKKEVVEESIMLDPEETIDKVEEIQKEPTVPEYKEEVIEENTITQEDTTEEVKKAPPKKKETNENVSSNIESLFTKKKKEKGKQQSIYFKKDVYDFCNGIAERYELGISDVVNELIASIMEDAE